MVHFWSCTCGSGLDRYERSTPKGRFLGWVCPKCDPDQRLSIWQRKAIEELRKH